MMLFDHIASSIILSNSIQTIRKRKILWIVCVFSSIAPDILAFFFYPGSVEYLSHRKYTNSILLAPFYVLAIATIFKFVSIKSSLPFYKIYLVSLLSYYLHIFLDIITPFGSPLLYPLSDNLYSLDIIHSFDPFFLTVSIFLIVISIFSIFKRVKSFNRITKLTLYIYLFYFLTMTFYKIIVSNNYEKYLHQNYPNSHYEITTPKTFWRWRGIASEKNEIIQLNGLLQVDKVEKFHSINDLPEFIRKDDYYKKFISYSRYPVVQINKKQISIFNAIYSPESYRLIYEIQGDSIISKQISGFDLIDK